MNEKPPGEPGGFPHSSDRWASPDRPVGLRTPPAAEPEMTTFAVNAEHGGELLLLTIVEALVERVERRREPLLLGNFLRRRGRVTVRASRAVRAHLVEAGRANLCGVPKRGFKRAPVLLLRGGELQLGLELG